MRNAYTRLLRTLLGRTVAVLLFVGAPGVALSFHSADYNLPDWSVNLSELLRAIQFYNVGGYSCDPQGEDGYAAGAGDKTCPPHDGDYNVQDWSINLSELLRLIQFYNVGVYHEDSTGEDGYAPGPAPAVQVAVTGQVTGSGALAGVAVSAGGAASETGAEGFFLLEGVPVGADDRVVVTFEKAGYARTQKTARVAGREVVDLPTTLLPHAVAESVDPGAAQDLQGFNGASEMIVRFVLPADALVGAAPGNVTVSLTYGDPSTPTGLDAFPGEFVAAPALGEPASIPIESVVFADIAIVDSQGTEITEFSTPAEILLRLPDDFQSGGARAGTFVAGDPERGWIPWWTYDEGNSSWYRDDANPEELGVQDAQVLEVAGVLYSRALLSHLTTVNCDVPIPMSCLEVQVVDPDGDPLPGITVTARGTTYRQADAQLTDETGWAQLAVKRSDPSSLRELAVVNAYYGSLRYPYDVVNEAEGEVDIDRIFTPDTPIPLCQELRHPIEMTIVGTIDGTVLHGGEPVDTAVYLLGSPTVSRTDPATGRYTIKGVPLLKQVFLKVEGAPLASTLVEDRLVPAVVDFWVNYAPMVASFSRSPNDSPVAPGTTVFFSVTADDPDGDEFTVSWAATDGSPQTQVEGPVSGAVESVFEWVAPASPQTVSISVAVEDSLGAITSRSMDVVVGGGTGDRLTVTVRDDPVSNQVVPGARVVLYESDHVTVADHKLTDPATGVADFGVLDRDRVTVAIAHETSTDPSTVFRVFHMFVDVPSGEWVYYLYGARDRLFSCPAPDAILRVVSVESPFAAQRAWLEPMGWGDFSSPIGFLDVPVCRDAVQEDGTFMPLVLGFQGVFGNTSVHWFPNEEDAIEVPPLAPGGTPLEIEQVELPSRGGPGTLLWETDPQTVATGVALGGVRKGVPYRLSAIAGGTTFGQMPAPRTFPVDAYWVSLSTDAATDGVKRTTDARHGPLPPSVVIPVRDWDLSGPVFEAGDTVRWVVTAATASPRDAVFLEGNLTRFEMPNVFTDWRVILGGASESWRVPSLPPELPWSLLPADFLEYGSVSLKVVDLDNVGSLDEAWVVLQQGGSLEKNASRVHSLERADVPLPTPASVAPRSVLSAGTPEQSYGDTGTLLESLRGLDGLKRR